MTAEACGECHIAEFDVWKKTPHATGFKTLHRKEQAETIAKKMGFRLIKRDSLCFSCHYTPVVDDGRIRVVSGVSCESCHGAGADWIDVHNDYGAAGNYRNETAEARQKRIDRSRRAGMRRPSDLYPVVANCFSCHTVPSEKLVNIGGHTTGSGGFEFVEWSQERIRHNFLEGVRSGNQGPNATRP
ncbi:MAG: cytochrome c family protein, partial [Acidobacteriota bacterium]|nr:cytochrome c family protein [Acidobacteriota bacterium]